MGRAANSTDTSRGPIDGLHQGAASEVGQPVTLVEELLAERGIEVVGGA